MYEPEVERARRAAGLSWLDTPVKYIRTIEPLDLIEAQARDVLHDWLVCLKNKLLDYEEWGCEQDAANVRQRISLIKQLLATSDTA
jgi:hypothetical protein